MKAEKPNKLKNYGSIPHLSNSKLGIGDYFIEKGQEKILTEKVRDRHDTVIVQEKYDGSNVGVLKIDNKIYALTRAGYEAKSSPYIQHHYFANWVQKHEKMFLAMLSNNERIVGEWLLQAHGIKYHIQSNFAKENPIKFFDYFNAENKRLIWVDMLFKVQSCPIPLARVLHIGQSVNPESLLSKLYEKHYDLHAEKAEGMVYRCERNGKVDFLAKWVRPDFEAGKYCIGVPENELIWNVNISTFPRAK